MYFTIYKVTNKINGKIYIGAHKTDDLNDGYMGSGQMIKNAIAKHGISFFDKEIIAIFSNVEEMYEYERKLVNQQFIASGKTYNIKEGGRGGWSYVNRNRLNLYGLNGKTPNCKINLEKGREKRRQLKIAEDLWLGTQLKNFNVKRL